MFFFYKHRHRENRAAFSLIELMIVVGIVGLIALMAVPSMRVQMQRTRVRSAATQLQSQLRLLRMQAVSGSRPAYVSLDVPNRVLVYRYDANADGSVASNEVVRVLVSKDRGVGLVASATNGVFRASGAFQCPGGYWRVQITHPDVASRYIYVFQGGHIEHAKRKLD